MRTAEQIAELYEQRRKKAAPWLATASTIKQIYNGEFVVPLPEMDANELPAVANLLYQGVEAHSSRVASTMPTVYYPAIRTGKKGAEDRARNRRLVNLAWWDANNLRLKMQKRARHLTAYAASPVMMRPDFKEGQPCWYVRDPLCTFPADMQPGEIHPADCIFGYTQRFSDLLKRYPDAFVGISADPESTWELIEYTDADQYTLVAVGECDGTVQYRGGPRVQRTITLATSPNRLEKCWAVVPSRVTLDRWKGQFDGIVGMYVTQAMLMALEVIGMKRAVFPEVWAVSRTQGEAPNIIRYADPIQGVVGQIENGTIESFRTDPSVLNTQIIDRLERNQRIEAVVPAELGGESTSNIRTGRRGDAILAASVDFPVQLAQNIFEQSLQVENELAVAIDKTYFNRRKQVWISATKGQIEYTPSDLWETDKNYVRYSYAGTDANTLVVSGGQRVGLGTLSKRGFMEMDPLVEDAEAEHDRIIWEALEQAMLASLQERAAQDPTFAPVVAEIAAKVAQDKLDVFEAYKVVDKAMKEQQAGLVQAPPEQGQPGAAQPLAPVNEPSPGVDHMTSLLMSLKNGSRAVA